GHYASGSGTGEDGEASPVLHGVEIAPCRADPFAVSDIAVHETDAVAAFPVEVAVQVETYLHSRRDEGEREGIEVGRRGHGHGAAPSVVRGRAQFVVLRAAKEGEHVGPPPSLHTPLDPAVVVERDSPEPGFFFNDTATTEN